MKKFGTRWLLVFVLLLGMSVTACGLFEAEPTPRPTVDDDDDGGNEDNDPEEENEDVEDVDADDEDENEEESTEVEPVEEEPVEEVIDEPEDDGLLGGLFAESVNVSETVQEFDVLDSYQMDMQISTTYSETTETVQATILVSTDPPQSQMTFSFAGFDGGTEMESMTMTQIEGTSYIDVPEFGCITTSEEDSMGESFADSIDANQFLDEVGEAQFVGEETINGVETLHYTFDETTLQDEISDYNWVRGDVYIAQEGNYVVRFYMEGEGALSDIAMALDENEVMPASTVGQIVVQMDITNINEPLNITLPVGCENSGQDGTEYPVLEDADEFSSFGNFISYTTETAFADIVTFYQESLAAQDWTYLEGESIILDGSTALLYFTQDGRNLSVTVSEEGGGTGFTVLVLEE
ncbi:MAG: hypothetical protein DHS20C20_25910 [Ardenticatenaceae bacterium]|nr:MAG: hypothetical protein DHS20C20_25910 [Ardenticatenaceae bacterium]